MPALFTVTDDLHLVSVSTPEEALLEKLDTGQEYVHEANKISIKRSSQDSILRSLYTLVIPDLRKKVYFTTDLFQGHWEPAHDLSGPLAMKALGCNTCLYFNATVRLNLFL